ncbi:MAG TPA: nitroreductase family protein [Candidatus Paceibacterota bacterium]|nr:nitroreductase family protein [Candidatus Paceibacterota bacterium]
MTDFLNLTRGRKSVRSFSDQTVSRELIERIIMVATYAPTACNQQLWNFTVVTEKETKEQLIREASSSTIIRKAPVIVVVSYDGWNYKEAIQNSSLAVGYILLAASNYGLGSLPVNSYGSDSKIKKILKIPLTQTICCFVLLGYPDGKSQISPLVPRRDLSEVFHWGQFTPAQEISYDYNPEKWTIESLVLHQKRYCRKTFLGKEMDIMSEFERCLVSRELLSASGPILDFFCYDGAYLREFPSTIDLTVVDLCQETSEYTMAAASFIGKNISSLVFNNDTGIDFVFATSTILFKLERLPKVLRQWVYQQATGEFIIVARKSNIFLSIFFLALKVIFGPDIRRTGIFSFFGPYQPISLSVIIKELKMAGFKDIKWSGYFILPPLFEQIYQMFLQHRASEGSSYLHRDKRVNFVSRLIAHILRLQGLRNFGRFGSVVVIKCHK